jgi:hypothetical protein
LSIVVSKPSLTSISQHVLATWILKTLIIDPHQANGSLKILQDPALDSPLLRKNLQLKPKKTQKNAFN